MRLIASFFLTLATAFAPTALAQDPPGRVGRLAYTEGTVGLYHDPEEGWEKAYVNSPVTSENSIWTDPNSRAEMRVSGIAIRLDETTQLDIANLDDDDFSAFVARGAVAIRVRHFENSNRLDFATPHARFRLFGTGRYRVDVDADRDETVFTVFTGSASMRSASGDIKIEAGRAIRVGGGASPSFVRERAASNAFDRWTLARDEKWIEGRSTQYVSNNMTGYEDLDQYGQWAQEPEYGAIWYPSRVARDWVPYRHGRWDWIRPWGWTWIAEEPWGYAPYHYGRWVQVRDRWGWYPGERVARPVWAPALVGWVGGANFSVRIGGGTAPALGWYPLAPWERYDPWYRTNTAYNTRINRNVRDIAPRQWQGRERDEWRYLNRERGATVVRRDQFNDRRPVTQIAVPVTPEVIRQAQVAPATNLLPGREEFRRARRDAGQPPAMPQGGASAQAPQVQQQAQQPAEKPFQRPGERGGPSARPNFERRQAPPAPVAAPATAAQPQAAPAQAQQPASRPGSPFAREDQRTQERAASEQQQAQQRAAREAQQNQERAQREAQQAQERAAREAQQGQAQQQQQQQQQRQAQERAQREAQQAQERAAREAQQGQAQQQQQQQQQQQAQERAAREAQQQQQRQQTLQQQAQERIARDAQRQQALQQQAQERAAREAQRAQPQQPPAQPQQAQPAQVQPAQDQPPQALPQRPERERGKDRDKDDEKARDKDDDNKPGKGRGRN